MEGDLRWCCGSSSNDWDLHAVVRFASCSGGSRVTSPRASDESFSCLPLPAQSHKDELTEAAALQQRPVGPAVDDFYLQQAFSAEAPPQQQPPAKPRASCRNNGVGGPTRSKRKRKKSQVSNKEVTRVPVGASPDPWAWRKYRQKPMIKGSPYPRGYYRCSTDKDCRARKQVERCRTDPSTLIVSYTGELSHPVPLHRNTLAGTTRNKPQPAPCTSPAEQPLAASPIDTTTTTTTLLYPSVGVEYEEGNTVAASLLLEDAETEGEEDVLLFLNPALPSNGSGSKDDVMLFPEPHRPAPGADNYGGGSEKVVPLSKLRELPLLATTSRGKTGDGSGAAPEAMNFTHEKCPSQVSSRRKLQRRRRRPTGADLCCIMYTSTSKHTAQRHRRTQTAVNLGLLRQNAVLNSSHHQHQKCHFLLVT